VSFSTTKNTWRTAPGKCHVNYVVLDSDWEAELARVLEGHTKVRAYVKNQGMQFEVPYRDGALPRKYIPDFIVQVDDGHDEPLNLILETKGYRGGGAQLKAETLRTLWLPGVNNLGTFGRWAFEEFTDVFEIEAAFGRLIREMSAEKVEA
jgi:type III restriction enzyme